METNGGKSEQSVQHSTAKTDDQDTGALEQKASSLAGTEVLRSGSLHLNPLLQVTLRDHQLTGGPPILGWDMLG